jgi:hypothetical protein
LPGPRGLPKAPFGFFFLARNSDLLASIMGHLPSTHQGQGISDLVAEHIVPKDVARLVRMPQHFMKPISESRPRMADSFI